MAALAIVIFGSTFSFTNESKALIYSFFSTSVKALPNVFVIFFTTSGTLTAGFELLATGSEFSEELLSEESESSASDEELDCSEEDSYSEDSEEDLTSATTLFFILGATRF